MTEFKQAPKAAKLLMVPCRMADCLYNEGWLDGTPGIAKCSHPQKPQNMAEGPCALYRLDWQKRMGALNGLAAKR